MTAVNRKMLTKEAMQSRYILTVTFLTTKDAAAASIIQRANKTINEDKDKDNRLSQLDDFDILYSGYRVRRDSLPPARVYIEELETYTDLYKVPLEELRLLLF